MVRTTVHLKLKTQAEYASLLRTHIHLWIHPLAQIEPLVIHEWVADLLEDGLSAARVRQAHQVLAASLKSAVQSGYLARSPAIGIQLPRVPRREMKFLTPAEAARLASMIAEPYGPWCTYLCTAGSGGERPPGHVPSSMKGVTWVKVRRATARLWQETGSRVHHSSGRMDQSSIRVWCPWWRAAQAAQSDGRPSEGGHDGTRARLDHVLDDHRAAG